MAHSVTIPGRSLAIVLTYNSLKPHQSGSLYDIILGEVIVNKHPNIYLIPMIHNVDVHRTERLPLVVINFTSDDISLLRGDLMGSMHPQSLDILEIITETSTEPSSVVCENMVTEILNKQEKRKKR